MTNLADYLQDGACAQARATLMFLQRREIEQSWEREQGRYLAEPKVARWENCREQGYIIRLRSKDYQKQLNIIFFEHRNSDSLCAVKWEQVSMNSITIQNADFGNVYKDKYDVSHSVPYGQVSEMATWIHDQMCLFWDETINQAVKDN